jgi:hypothetical protein
MLTTTSYGSLATPYYSLLLLRPPAYQCSRLLPTAHLLLLTTRHYCSFYSLLLVTTAHLPLLALQVAQLEGAVEGRDLAGIAAARGQAGRLWQVELFTTAHLPLLACFDRKTLTLKSCGSFYSLLLLTCHCLLLTTLTHHCLLPDTHLPLPVAGGATGTRRLVATPKP